MKYTQEIIIKQPIGIVLGLYSNLDNLPKWKTGILSSRLLSGEKGKNGAKTELIYQLGDKTHVVTETIIRKKLPGEFTSTYETTEAFMTICHRFEKIDDYTTRWISYNEYEQKGFWRLANWFTASTYKKETQMHMDQFKAFAESQPVLVSN
ncbi:MAG: SRPBCC family protein [Cytophagales bacterium]|nr:SRPBCC family protein [Cytophagales bacterium]